MFVYVATGLLVYLSLKKYEEAKSNELVQKKKSLSIFYKYLAIVILTLVFGLRAYSVGTDTKNYLQIFDSLGSDFIFEKMIYEKGFCILSIFSRRYFGSFTALLLISGFIIYWNIITSICELSQSPSISMLCFFGLGAFAQSCNLLRQYLALSFCLIAMLFLIKKNKNLLFILYVLIAFLFHRSAIVFLILLPLKYIKFNIRNIFLFLVGTALAIVFLPYLLKFFDRISGSHYYTYITIRSETLSLVNIGVIVILSVVLFFILKFRRQVNKEESVKEYDIYANMFLLFFCLIIVSIFSAELVDRIAIYFLPAMYFLLPMILKTFKDYKSKFFVYMLAIVFLIFLVYILKFRGTYEILPYDFVKLF